MLIYKILRAEVGESMELERPEYIYDCTGRREADKHRTH